MRRLSDDMTVELKQAAHFDEFFDAYIEAALWSSNDNADESGGEPLDANYSEDDFDDEALQNLTAIARVWYFRNSCYIAALIDKGGKPDYAQSAWSLYQLAGHDLWLTQNGHGTGFWDRDHWGCYQDMFDKQAKALGQIDITVGDDKKLYI